MPIFVRGGGIIPTMPEANRIPAQDDHLTLHLYPHAQRERACAWLWGDDQRAELRYFETEDDVRLSWQGSVPPQLTLCFHLRAGTHFEVSGSSGHHAVREDAAGAGTIEIDVDTAQMQGQIALKSIER